MYRYEIPDIILKNEFNWCDDDDGFILYKGYYYHLSQFLIYKDPYWDGVTHDSWWSGVLVKVLDDGDVVMGTFV